MRDAIRALVRTPIYSIVAILTLALGIGASTAGFTVFNGILLAPLPYDEPQQLVTVSSRTFRDTTSLSISHPDFEDYAREQRVFADMGWTTLTSTTLHRAEGNVTVWVAMVSDDFLPVLRARPTIGRLLTPADNRPGAPPVTVLTHEMWVNYFGADPSVIGRDLDLPIGHYTVVGVLNTGAGWPDWVRYNDGSMYVPVNSAPTTERGAFTSRQSQPAIYLPITHPVPSYVWAVARTTVPPRTVISTIRRRVNALDPYLVPTTGMFDETDRVAIGLAGPAFQMSVLGLFSTVALILAALGLYGVIAFSVTQRTSEIGIRMALGARAADVARLVIQGASVLVVTGLILGALGALVLGRTMRSMLYGVGPYDPMTLLGVAAVLATVAALASYVPARRAARVEPTIALRAE